MVDARKAEMLKFHEEIRALLEHYGFVDFFYGGVDYDEETTCGLRVGQDGTSRANVNRCYLIKGMLSDMEQSLGRNAKPPSIILLATDDMEDTPDET